MIFFLDFSLSLTLRGTWVLISQRLIKSICSPNPHRSMCHPLTRINKVWSPCLLPSSHSIQPPHRLHNDWGCPSHHTTACWKVPVGSLLCLYFIIFMIWKGINTSSITFCYFCSPSPLSRMHYTGAIVLKSDCALGSPRELLTETSARTLCPEPTIQLGLGEMWTSVLFLKSIKWF